MFSITQEVQRLKKKVDELICLLSNSTGGGGGGAETDPTVRASIKTLTDEDVANVKGLITNPYIPLSGFDIFSSKATPKSIFFSNYDYISNNREEGDYLIMIGANGYQIYNGVQNNVTDYYEFGHSMEYGLKWNQSVDYFGVRNINRFSMSKYGSEFYYAVINDSDGFSKSGAMVVNNFGAFSFNSSRTSNTTGYSDYTSFDVLPEGAIQISTYEGSTAQSKFFRFSKNDIRTDNFIDAFGNSDFNKVVVKDVVGRLGEIPISEIGGSTAGMMPEVTIMEFYKDATNYILKVSVHNLPKLQFGPGLFEVCAGSTPIYANDVTVGYDANAMSLTEDPYAAGITFTITFPIATNTALEWIYDDRSITVTWRGTYEHDFNNGLEFDPPRIASDTKLVSHLRPASTDEFSRASQIRDVVYKQDTNNYIIEGYCTIAATRDFANNTAALTLKSFYVSGFEVSGTGITFTNIIVNPPAFITSNTLRDSAGGLIFGGFTTWMFRITIPKATNGPVYNNTNSWISFILECASFSSSNMFRKSITVPFSLTAKFNSVYQTPTTNNTLMPFLTDMNADATAVRNVIQRADGTLGWETKNSLPAKRFYMRNYFSAGTTSIDNTTADVIQITANTGMDISINALSSFGNNYNNGDYFIMITPGNAEQINITCPSGITMVIHRTGGGVEYYGNPYPTTPLPLYLGKRYLVSYQTQGLTIPMIQLYEFN